MKRLRGMPGLLTAAVVLGATLSAHAQTLRLHDHPQKTTYADPSQWPAVDAQCHFAPRGYPPDFSDTTLAHLHLIPHAPIYAEVSGPMRIRFDIKMFQFRGILNKEPVWGRNVRDVVFDGTGTATPPILEGDPNGLIVESGLLTIDPLKDNGWGPFPPHGWAQTFIALNGQLLNGKGLQEEATLTFWSLLDPSAPATGNSEGGYPTVGSKCNNSIWNGDQLGATAMEALSYLPLAPFSTPWPLATRAYSYGEDHADEMKSFPNLTEISLDLDLHMGVEGTQILQVPGFGNQGLVFPPERPYLIDPAVIGTGRHAIGFRWELTTGTGSEHFLGGQQIWALLTWPFTADPSAPPSPVSSGGSSEPPAPTPPPAPPPSADPPPVTFTSDKSSVAVGESYTLTAVIDESKNNVHNVTIDGVSWAAMGCTVALPTITCRLPRTATTSGTVTDTFIGFNPATGTNWAPLAVTVSVR